MSKIKNGGLHQYGAGRSKQQQFGTAGIEGIKVIFSAMHLVITEPRKLVDAGTQFGSQLTESL